MAMIDGLLQELEQEAQTTRRVLERVPDAHLNWKPHPKSMTLGQLAMHVAIVPGGVAEAAAQPAIQRPMFPQPSPSSASELVPMLEDSVKRARKALGGMDDAAMNATWKVLDGDRELMVMPRVAFVRSIMLNHWYHHRGQLSVYLRQLNVPVPSIYGPSADENPFETPQTAAASAR
jgi:uncharacterized damage-inducible protein DinB